MGQVAVRASVEAVGGRTFPAFLTETRVGQAVGVGEVGRDDASSNAFLHF